MAIRVYQLIDTNDFWVKEDVIDESSETAFHLIAPYPLQNSFIKPKWDTDTSTWIEGETTAEENTRLYVDLRTARTSLLYKCDWTQASDVSTNNRLTAQQITDWATYRQELADLPANTPDPKNITWPTEPS